jgi:hypothetical protein
LQEHGVDTKNITLGDLETIYTKRLKAIANSSENYNIALPDATVSLPEEWALPRQ